MVYKNLERARELARKRYERDKARRVIDPEFAATYTKRRTKAVLKHRNKNIDAFKEYASKRSKRLRSSRETWGDCILTDIKKRAKEKGVPFNLEKGDLVAPEKCPVLGFDLVFGSGPNETLHGPSVDRLIPELGYVKGNVFVISKKANNYKNSCVDSNELRQVADWMDQMKSESHSNPTLFRLDCPKEIGK